MPIFNFGNIDEIEELFNEQLERCGLEYFDYYMLHNVCSKDKDKLNKNDLFNFIKEKKQEGKIKHIGISSHDTADFLEEILIKYPEIEFVQLQINYLDWNDEIIQSRKCYEVATKYNKPVIIMEGLKVEHYQTFHLKLKKYLRIILIILLVHGVLDLIYH